MSSFVPGCSTDRPTAAAMFQMRRSVLACILSCACQPQTACRVNKADVVMLTCYKTGTLCRPGNQRSGCVAVLQP